ncbi:MAG: cysteine--tRNA ligase [Thermoplasmata archaeon]
MMLKIYNTLSGNLEEFKPREPGVVRMYVCGPTVYDYCHVGHARSYVCFDIIRRYLEYLGYRVIFVQNFTDVDDKIIARSNETGEDPRKLAERFISAFFEDMHRLKVKPATYYPRVTEHISEIISTISKLIEKGYAYASNGSVYFRVKKAKAFGKLSKQNIENMRNLEINEDKEEPWDFALWKKAKEGEIYWESPWGNGRPGWHIECSVMSMHYLGASFDIHGGGMDLIFPHHECEILQSEAYSGAEFVKYWLHNGFLTINREKMSKSLGNFFTIREVLRRFEPDVLRFFIAYAHYRSPIDFSDIALEEAKAALKRLRTTYSNILAALAKGEFGLEKVDIANYRQRFFDAMNEDFNTREAIAVLFELSSVLNEKMQHLDMFSLSQALHFYNECSAILGIDFEKKGDADRFIEFILEMRAEARKRKEWDVADRIRAKLRELGVEIEDTAQSTSWRYV